MNVVTSTSRQHPVYDGKLKIWAWRIVNRKKRFWLEFLLQTAPKARVAEFLLIDPLRKIRVKQHWMFTNICICSRYICKKSVATERSYIAILVIICRSATICPKRWSPSLSLAGGASPQHTKFNGQITFRYLPWVGEFHAVWCKAPEISLGALWGGALWPRHANVVQPVLPHQKGHEGFQAYLWMSMSQYLPQHMGMGDFFTWASCVKEEIGMLQRTIPLIRNCFLSAFSLIWHKTAPCC